MDRGSVFVYFYVKTLKVTSHSGCYSKPTRLIVLLMRNTLMVYFAPADLKVLVVLAGL